MAEWTPDPERHRPEGMDVVGWVSGLRPEPSRALVNEAAFYEEIQFLRSRLERAEEALRAIAFLTPTPFIEDIVRAYLDSIETA